jgi:hypothetical protein
LQQKKSELIIEHNTQQSHLRTMDDPKEDQRNLSERLLGSDVEELDPMAQQSAPGEIVVDPLQAGQGFRGENQTPEYRDAPFAIGFVAHLMVVLFLSFSWGIGALKQDDTTGTSSYQTDDDKPAYNPDDGDDSVSLSGLLWLCLLTSLASIAISAASLELMTRHAEQLIQISLITSCGILGLLVMFMFANQAALVAFFMLFALVFTGLYAYTVWNRIPFAAANLQTALSAIQTNYGVCLLAYGIAFVANIWLLLWSLAFIGVSYKESTCQDGVCKSNMDPISFFLLVISYHWTNQVLKVCSLITPT